MPPVCPCLVAIAGISEFERYPASNPHPMLTLFSFWLPPHLDCQALLGRWGKIAGCRADVGHCAEPGGAQPRCPATWDGARVSVSLQLAPAPMNLFPCPSPPPLCPVALAALLIPETCYSIVFAVRPRSSRWSSGSNLAVVVGQELSLVSWPLTLMLHPGLQDPVHWNQFKLQFPIMHLVLRYEVDLCLFMDCGCNR